MKAQGGVEFLVMFSMILLVFAFSVFTYSSFMEQSAAVKTNMEAQRICHQVASSVSSLVALGSNATYQLSLPDRLDYSDYTIRVFADNRYVRVDYGSQGVGCSLRTTAITDSTGSRSFQLQPNATLVSNGGVLVVYP